MKDIKTIEFNEGVLQLIDQRELPSTYTYYYCTNYRDVEFAIRDMVVRGAPAIGATAAYGMYLAALEFSEERKETFLSKLREAANFLERSRPTAVNLHWAVHRMLKIADLHSEETVSSICEALHSEADAIHDEDLRTNRRIGNHGNAIIPDKASILTHCNTGALATVGWGTALGVVREAYRSGKEVFVYADETRPRLQGARLTAWELVQEHIPGKLIADNTAAFLMQQGKVDLVIVGADRIALNGDTTNKIGTYMLAVSAKEHGIPFYVAAPISTIDFSIESGEEIRIEERDDSELRIVNGTRVAPEEMAVYNPAFDLTPHQYITGIITESGIISPPYRERLAGLQPEE
jgi:methylthioribose-1-phosphate isomerase